MKQQPDNSSVEDDDTHAPILKTWQNVYILVAGVLLVIIILFYFFTIYFA